MAEKMHGAQISRRICSWLLPLGIVLAFSSASAAAAGEWPEGCVPYEKSRSPDGHYGIVLPSRETGVEHDTDNDNYFADLTAQRVLGKIAGADYFEGQNHRGLQVTWAPDSKWCVATYEGRYGFDFISVMEPKGPKFTQTDVGEHIGKALDAIIKKQTNDREAEGYAIAHFRAQPDRKLLVRALAYTNPKQFENVRSLFAAFAGTFDLNSKKWTASRARNISSDEFDALLNGYSDYSGNFIVIKDPAKEKAPENFEGTILSSDAEIAEHFESELNEVYQAVRAALPAPRFAGVKEDQRAWLKKRDAISSSEEKYKFTEARIRILQDLLW
jgi:Lysozyme inhibitor LprI